MILYVNYYSADKYLNRCRLEKAYVFCRIISKAYSDNQYLLPGARYDDVLMIRFKEIMYPEFRINLGIDNNLKIESYANIPFRERRWPFAVGMHIKME